MHSETFGRSEIKADHDSSYTIGFDSLDFSPCHLVGVTLVVLFARESDLSNRGYLQLAQEISYQWLGALATPAWWSDAHLNKALVGYLAAEIAFKVQKVTTGKIDMGQYIS